MTCVTLDLAKAAIKGGCRGPHFPGFSFLPRSFPSHSFDLYWCNMAMANHIHRRAAQAVKRRSDASGVTPVRSHPRRQPPDIIPFNGNSAPNLPTDLPFTPAFGPSFVPPPVSALIPSAASIVDPSIASLVGFSTQPATSGSATTSEGITVSTSSTTPTSSVAVALPSVQRATATSLHHTISAATHMASPSGSVKPVTSSTSSTRSGANAAPIAGGVVVGVVALFAVVFIITAFLRRSWRYGEDHFDANEFRHSAVLVSDTSTYEGKFGGSGPRPPTMIERKLPKPSAQMFDQLHSLAPDSYPNAPNTYSVGNYYYDDHFAAARSMNPIATSVPPSPSSRATAGHHPPSDQASVLGLSPVTKRQVHPPSPRRTSRPASGNDPGAANGFTFPRRQPSGLTQTENQERKFTTDQVPPDDYVDLSRYSVSPFQAAQYAEISRRLNAEVPRGLNYHDANAWIAPAQSPSEMEDNPPPVPPKPLLKALRESPFEDPASRASVRDSGSSSLTALRGETPALQDFPAPPSSPILTLASSNRIDDLPPVLPELNLRNSGLYNGAFVPQRKSLMPKYQSASGVNTAEGAAESETDEKQDPSSPKRPETIYDPEDAYGGI